MICTRLCVMTYVVRREVGLVVGLLRWALNEEEANPNIVRTNTKEDIFLGINLRPPPEGGGPLGGPPDGAPGAIIVN